MNPLYIFSFFVAYAYGQTTTTSVPSGMPSAIPQVGAVTEADCENTCQGNSVCLTNCRRIIGTSQAQLQQATACISTCQYLQGPSHDDCIRSCGNIVLNSVNSTATASASSTSHTTTSATSSLARPTSGSQQVASSPLQWCFLFALSLIPFL